MFNSFNVKHTLQEATNASGNTHSIVLGTSYVDDLAPVLNISRDSYTILANALKTGTPPSRYKKGIAFSHFQEWFISFITPIIPEMIGNKRITEELLQLGSLAYRTKVTRQVPDSTAGDAFINQTSEGPAVDVFNPVLGQGQTIVNPQAFNQLALFSKILHQAIVLFFDVKVLKEINQTSYTVLAGLDMWMKLNHKYGLLTVTDEVNFVRNFISNYRSYETKELMFQLDLIRLLVPSMLPILPTLILDKFDDTTINKFKTLNAENFGFNKSYLQNVNSKELLITLNGLKAENKAINKDDKKKKKKNKKKKNKNNVKSKENANNSKSKELFNLDSQYQDVELFQQETLIFN